MFYQDLLQELMKDKSNPINSMYLNEIELFRKNTVKYVENAKGEDDIANLLEGLNEFHRNLAKTKYRTSKMNSNGFPKDSPLFGPIYLNDLVSFMVMKQPIMENQGIKWGFHSFSESMKLRPESLMSMDKKLNPEIVKSPELLQLSLQLDIQLRITGKRRFFKQTLYLPLIIFQTFGEFNEEDFIKADYHARKAKEAFGRSKMIIVTETLAPGFIPNLRDSAVDSIFILQKKGKISVDILSALNRKITDTLNNESGNIKKMIKSGEIDKRGFYE
jgi:hypothetical protein